MADGTFKRPSLRRRLSQAWRTARLGYPVAGVSYEVRRINDTTRCVEMKVRYIGRCHGHIDGEEFWTDNGTFTIVQDVKALFQ